MYAFRSKITGGGCCHLPMYSPPVWGWREASQCGVVVFFQETPRPVLGRRQDGSWRQKRLTQHRSSCLPWVPLPWLGLHRRLTLCFLTCRPAQSLKEHPAQSVSPVCRAAALPGQVALPIAFVTQLLHSRASILREQAPPSWNPEREEQSIFCGNWPQC